MGISRALRSRIERDAKAPDYWYVPHGQAVNAENWERIAEHLRVLPKFQTVPWEEAQPQYAKLLLKRNLIEPYKDHRDSFSAVARMQFPVWRLLGLAWVNASRVPEVTDVGHRFIDAKSTDRRRELLEMQLHRYQFYNPSIAPHFTDFRTFPVLSLYRLLSHADWKLDWDEFLLFGTRTRTFADADELADLVDEWRSLTKREREQLLAVAQTLQTTSHTRSKEGTTWRKLHDDFNYIQAALNILTTLNQSDKGIEVPKVGRRRVRRIVLEATGSAEVIDYESEQDWLALYGGAPAPERWSTPWTTASEARAYYERVGRIDAATAAYAKEEGRTEKAIEQYRKIQVLERVLEDLLEHNLDALEKGLTLVPNGRQYPTAVGPIDLLAQDENGIYVVIELKRGRSSDRVVGQIARYITWIVQRLGRGIESRVRGIVVGREFDKHFGAAVSQLKRVSPYTFDLRILFERWGTENEHRTGARR
jgi:endonuclease NucS-like protein